MRVGERGIAWERGRAGERGRGREGMREKSRREGESGRERERERESGRKRGRVGENAGEIGEIEGERVRERLVREKESGGEKYLNYTNILLGNQYPILPFELRPNIV